MLLQMPHNPFPMHKEYISMGTYLHVIISDIFWEVLPFLELCVHMVPTNIKRNPNE